MTDDAQNSTLALAVGNLTGTVAGLQRTLEEQNKSAAASRLEVMGIFNGIREDNKEQSEYLKKHIEEDAKVNMAVVELMTWKKDAAEKVDVLWDKSSRQTGAMGTMGIVGSVVGGAFVAIVEYLKK